MADNVRLYIGARGAGKSTLAACDALAAAREDVMVIVHDALKGFPCDVGKTCASMMSMRVLSASGVVTVIQAPPSTVKLEDVMAWCVKVARHMPNGALLILDEGVLLTTGEEPGVMRRKLREYVATARHHRLRIAIIAQGSMLVDHALIEQADHVALFRVVGMYEHNKLTGAGVPEEIARELRTLPDRHYYIGQPGRPAEEWTLQTTRIPVTKTQSFAL